MDYSNSVIQHAKEGQNKYLNIVHKCFYVKLYNSYNYGKVGAELGYCH